MNDMYAHQWDNQTTLHPMGLLAIVVLGSFMLLLDRRWAVLPMLVMACFIPSAQRIVVATLDFNLLRIMVLFGWLRLVIREEWRGFRWSGVDRLLIVWAVSATALYTVQQGTIPALVYKLGASFDAVGMYFLFRALVRGWDDILTIIRGVALLSVPLLMAFLIEHSTGRNLFSVFGGVPTFTIVRDGRLRVQGAFSHSILAGTFWAMLLPLFLAMWCRGGRDRFYTVIGTISSLAIVVLTASSTPILAVAAGLLGMGMWIFRHWMRPVRYGVVAMLIFLHLSMNAPVWFLIARMDIVGGSTGWDRSHLIDEAIHHFGEWWIVGTPSTAHWGYGLYDVVNQYILEGVRGGALTMVLFMLVIAYSFRNCGILWRAVNGCQWKAVIAWALGVALFADSMVFLAVSFFGQIIVIWYLLLASITSLTIAARAPNPARKPRYTTKTVRSPTP